MDTKQLKQRILDLAIRGKLVPQDPNDEPASVLLERIRAEKEQLIAQGKLKKSKTKASDKPHYENVPFEIPENWEWVIVEDVFAFHQGIQVDKDKQSLIPQKGYVRFLRIIDYTQSLEPPRYVKDPGKIYHVSPTDLVMIRYGSPGTPCMGYDGVIANNLFRIIPFVNNSIECKYAYHFFTTSYFQAQCRATGVAMSAISFSTINKIAFPLPPLAEQQRIVAEIEKWFALIDELEANKEDLKEYIKQVKSNVLDLAIHGKLVPQDPNDEPAIELLKRINPNFKPCDTSHYENLPAGWSICLLEDIIDYEQPTQYIVASTDYNDEYKTPVLTAGKSFILGYTNESNGIYNNLPTIIFDDFTTDSRLVNFPFKVKSSAMKILQVDKDISIQYVAYFMSITRLAGNTHKRYWISEYSKIPIPIPPKEEQDRIVQIISEIENKLDSISAEL